MIDLIIPTYNDKDNLIKTLESVINEDFFNITVVDDCSFPRYKEEIIKLFPKVNFMEVFQNRGPGCARQYGINNTKQPYIMFIDSGDLFLENKNFYNIIQSHPKILLFDWRFLDEKINKLSQSDDNMLHGKIYSRAFLNKYNIAFNKKSAYCNQDIGFNRLIKLLLKDNERLCINEPLILRTFDKNSLTHKNNNQFLYKQQNLGLAINEINVFNKARENGVQEQKLQEQANIIMVSLYSNVYTTAHIRPQFLTDSWRGARLFYLQVYRQYERDSSTIIPLFSNEVKKIYKQGYDRKIPLNIKRFLKDLKNFQEPPSYFVI